MLGRIALAGLAALAGIIPINTGINDGPRLRVAHTPRKHWRYDDEARGFAGAKLARKASRGKVGIARIR